MKPEIRTFIAVKINPDKALLDAFAGLKKRLKDDRINWVNENNFHLTLRFLGNTTRAQVGELMDRLGQVAARFEPFGFDIEGAGFFKNKGVPRVLFVKISGFEKLKQLAAAIEKEVVELGFEPETKKFKSHLTLGRIKFVTDKNRFYEAVEPLKETRFQQVEVSEFIFYQSILRPEGPVYKPLKKFQLR